MRNVIVRLGECRWKISEVDIRLLFLQPAYGDTDRETKLTAFFWQNVKLVQVQIRGQLIKQQCNLILFSTAYLGHEIITLQAQLSD